MCLQLPPVPPHVFSSNVMTLPRDAPLTITTRARWAESIPWFVYQLGPLGWVAISASMSVSWAQKTQLRRRGRRHHSMTCSHIRPPAIRRWVMPSAQTRYHVMLNKWRLEWCKTSVLGVRLNQQSIRVRPTTTHVWQCGTKAVGHGFMDGERIVR